MNLTRFPIDRADFDGPVLVTGAGGCIGSWALAILTRAGVPAVVSGAGPSVLALTGAFAGEPRPAPQGWEARPLTWSAAGARMLDT